MNTKKDQEKRKSLLLAQRDRLQKEIMEDLQSADAELGMQLAELHNNTLAAVSNRLERERSCVRADCCECCGRKIPPARLKALPYTTLCVGCQREEEVFSHSSQRTTTNTGWGRVHDESEHDPYSTSQETIAR